jgi:hypothetical protein
MVTKNFCDVCGEETSAVSFYRLELVSNDAMRKTKGFFKWSVEVVCLSCADRLKEWCHQGKVKKEDKDDRISIPISKMFGKN